MYTLHNAARFLGVNERTVRKWIRQDGIEVTVVETDRKRVYLAYDDVLALADKHRPVGGELKERVKNAQKMTGLYSIADVADLLGVKYVTVRHWLRGSNIQKTLITTDKKRVYIAYTDVLTLAEVHNRTIPYDNLVDQQDGNAQADGNTQENSSSQAEHNVREDSDAQADDHSQGDRLYTVADAALFLGIAEETLRHWLALYDIEGRKLEGAGRRIYIAYSDIMMLASKRKRKSVYPISVVDDIGEIKSRLVRLEAGMLNLENYIKRSIYIPK